jgi:hypothetical protein
VDRSFPPPCASSSLKIQVKNISESFKALRKTSLKAKPFETTTYGYSIMAKRFVSLFFRGRGESAFVPFS